MFYAQNNGFVIVRSEEEARNYPVAFGNSVTFKDENAPYVYVKTMSFSQFDRPVFEKYRLVKETPSEASNLTHTGMESSPDIKSTIDGLNGEIKAIWAAINGMKEAGKNDEQ